MFKLIITVISIGLTVAIAAAAVSYGGDAFFTGQTKAAVAQLANQTTQIKSASKLYDMNNSGVHAPTLATLVPSYLASIPLINAATGIDQTWNFNYNGTQATLYILNINAAVCDEITPAATRQKFTKSLGTTAALMTNMTTSGGFFTSFKPGPACIETTILGSKAHDQYIYMYKF